MTVDTALCLQWQHCFHRYLRKVLAMYYNFTVDVPVLKGKICRQTTRSGTYILYITGRRYDHEKQHTIPDRIPIGRAHPEKQQEMYPNEAFFTFFPETPLPEISAAARSRIAASIASGMHAEDTDTKAELQDELQEAEEQPSFLASEYPASDPKEAGFHIIPVPLERTVSYGGGTRLGPAHILEASQQLEAWDGISAPGELGIYTHPAINCDQDLSGVFADTEKAVQEALSCGAIPVVLGGEHTVSYAPVHALAQAGRTFGILHFDAHCDLRSIYEDDRFSHACVLRRIVEDCHCPLVQFATRDYCREEADFRKKAGITGYDSSLIASQGLPARPLPASFPKDIYITFDVDGFDSSLMPATGTPSPGGLFWYQAMQILEVCLKGRRIIGFDVVELAPIEGLHHADFTAAKLVHTLMGLAQRSMK